MTNRGSGAEDVDMASGSDDSSSDSSSESDSSEDKKEVSKGRLICYPLQPHY
jgi:hypothetical protein